ncbi:hypothetical protein [Mucilaginibacter sp. HD30]
MKAEVIALVNIHRLIQLAGLAQLILALGSLAIPKLLNWRGSLLNTTKLIQQMFWTYAAYILVINICFGLLSVFCYHELANGSRLAVLINGFIGVYWISRLIIQFFYFDRAAFPQGGFYLAGEFLLVLVFVALSVVYSYAFMFNAFLQ